MNKIYGGQYYIPRNIIFREGGKADAPLSQERLQRALQKSKDMAREQAVSSM